MTPKWLPKSTNWPPTWSPKMMPTWLYRQDFAKFSLNRHYNHDSDKKGTLVKLCYQNGECALTAIKKSQTLKGMGIDLGTTNGLHKRIESSKRPD
ncbi:hypothetical protein TNCV_1116861 [Trichonephila clavipes]|nr:hypothetical protein TNCV_1116861 [Trichonephila clavipes]